MPAGVHSKEDSSGSPLAFNACKTPMNGQYSWHHCNMKPQRFSGTLHGLQSCRGSDKCWTRIW